MTDASSNTCARSNVASTKPVSDEIMEKFDSLSNQLSPENLSCDGELSRTRVKQKYNMLMRQWHALEQKIGRKMEDSEVWDWYQNRKRV